MGNQLCLHKSKSPASLPVPLPAKRPAAASVQQNEPPSLPIHSRNEAIDPARSMSHYAWFHVLEWVDSRHPSACPPAPSLLAHPSAISVPGELCMPHVQYPIPLSTPTCRSFTLCSFPLLAATACCSFSCRVPPLLAQWLRFAWRLVPASRPAWRAAVRSRRRACPWGHGTSRGSGTAAPTGHRSGAPVHKHKYTKHDIGGSVPASLRSSRTPLALSVVLWVVDVRARAGRGRRGRG